MDWTVLILVAIATSCTTGHLYKADTETLVTLTPSTGGTRELSYQLVSLDNGRPGVRLQSVCNRTVQGCDHLNTSVQVYEDRQVAGGVLFFSFDNTNNRNLIYSKYGAIVGKINQEVEIQTLSDQCMNGLVFKRGFISLPHHNMKQKSMMKMSIVTWVKIDNFEHENTLYGCIGDDVMHHLEVKALLSKRVGAIRWLYRPKRSSTVFSEITVDIIKVGRWTHIAAVYDGDRGRVNIYVNGKNIYNDRKVEQVRQISWDGTFKVGMYPVQRGTSPFYLEGSMEEFGIYSEALDEDDVQTLMEKCDFDVGGEGLSLRYKFQSIANHQIDDASGNQNHGEIDGQLQLNQWTSKACKHSVHFSQGKGYIKLLADYINAQKGSGMTVAAWVRVDRVSRTNVVYGSFDDFLEKGYHYLAIGARNAINGPIIWRYEKDGETVFHVRTEQALSAGIWYHIIAMFDRNSGKVKIYQDGESIYSRKWEKNTGTILWGPFLSIGNRLNGRKMTRDEYFEGDMDNFEIYHATLKGNRLASLARKCRFTRGDYLFLVTVQTGNKHFGSTKGKVFVKFYGDDSEFGEFLLYKAGSTRGRSKIYTIYGKNIGNLAKISVRKQDTLISGEWYLEKIIVTLDDRVSGPVFIFPCNCWIGRNEQRFIEATRRLNGGWSSWSSWSGCGAGLCGGGKKVRSRSCTNPEPSGGAKECEGDSHEQQQCPIDGGWGAWSSWSLCSKTCGGALVTRTRKCDNPEPELGGKECEPKDAKETKEDCTHPCETGPRDGEWSEWSAWSACAKTCGGSVVTRSRECDNPAPARGGNECPGESKETAQDCLNPCPIDGDWGEWGEWTQCSATCGTGKKQRGRECDNPTPQFDGEECDGEEEENQPCKIRDCPNAVHGNWGEWGEWSPCSEKTYCNRGKKIRKRKCNNPKPKEGGDNCPGTNTDDIECPKDNCIAIRKNSEDSIEVDEDSELYYSCEADIGYLVSKSKDQPIRKILDDYFENIAEQLSTGYFAVQEITKEGMNLTKICFEPADMISIGQLKKLYPKIKLLTTPPSFKLPADDKHVSTINVILKEDKSLYAGNFLLDSADEYSPKEFTMESPEFYFQVTPDSQRIFVQGYKTIARAEFLMEVTGIGDKEFQAKGESKDSASASNIEAAIAKLSLEEDDDKTDGEKKKEEVDINKVIQGLTGLGDEEEEEEEDDPEEMKSLRTLIQSTHKRSQIGKPLQIGSPRRRRRKRRRRNHICDDKDCYPPDLSEVEQDDVSNRTDSKGSTKFVFADLFRRDRVSTHRSIGSDDSDKTATFKEHHLRTNKKRKNSSKKQSYHRDNNLRLANHEMGVSPRSTALVLYDKEKDDEKEGGVSDFFKNIDIKAFIFSALKQVGLGFLRVYDVSMGIHVRDKQFMIRVTGVAKPILYFETRVKFEIVKNGVFGVGITADRSDLGALTEKLFKKKINLFGKLRDPAIGFCFAQEGFKITDTTKFTREPLKSMIHEAVTGGLFFGISAKLPADCKDDTFCAFCVKLFGENTHIEFFSIIKKTMIKIAGRIVKRPEGSNKGKFRLSKIELFMEIQFKLVPPVLGFTVELAIPVNGDIFKNGAIVKQGELYVGGTIKLKGLSLTGELYMDGTWTKAFGIPFLAIKNVKIGVTINLIQGIPESFEFNGRVEIGIDCYGPDAFGHRGHCIGATALVGVSVNPLEEYIYGELSALTLGKIFRMLGSKLQMPKVVDETGFRGGIIVSAAMSDKEISYRSDKKKIKRGLFIKGMISILGLNPSVEIAITDEKICFDAELEKIKLLGGVQIVRSLKDTENGPKFLMKATRNSLDMQVYIHGAVKIFGADAELLLNVTKEQIQAESYFNLFSYLKTHVKFSAKYALNLQDTAFEAQVVIESHIEELVKNATAVLMNKLEFARKRIEESRVKVREAKESCIKKAEQACNLCKRITHSQIQVECHRAVDEFKHFIGNTVDKFGGLVKKFGGKLKRAFTRLRIKRYIELLLNGGKRKGVALYRHRRFISKLVCDKILGKAINAAKDLCEGSCNVIGHITKGMCRVLDLAQGALYLIEKSAYWIYQALPHIAKNMLYIHKLSFLTRISPSIDSKINGFADVSIFQARQKFEFEINLANIMESAIELGLRALEYFIGLFTERHFKSSYDNPSDKSDFQLSGEMKIVSMNSEKCLAVGDGGSLVLNPCTEYSPALEWAYTLTGSIMNAQSRSCLAFNKGSIELKECAIDSEKQKFECEDNLLMPTQDTDLCLTEADDGVSLESCDDYDLEDQQYWKLGDDSRDIDVCEKFVKDIAFKKPATQSSTKPFETEETNERINPGPELAVDGDMSPSLQQGSCIMTDKQKDPWWRVDLLKEYIVTDVSIVGDATDGMMALSSIETRVGKLKIEFWNNPMCGERLREVQNGEVWTSQCAPYIAGQYVSVQKIGTGKLVICEVAVFARLDKQGKCRKEVRRKRTEVALYKPFFVDLDGHPT